MIIALEIFRTAITVGSLWFLAYNGLYKYHKQHFGYAAFHLSGFLVILIAYARA